MRFEFLRENVRKLVRTKISANKVLYLYWSNDGIPLVSNNKYNHISYFFSIFCLQGIFSEPDDPSRSKPDPAAQWLISFVIQHILTSTTEIV